MNRSRITGDLVSQNNIFVDIANDRVGIGSTIPTQKLDVVGTVKATAFSGDGSGLSGVTSVGGDTGADFNDSVKVRFGTGNDLELYHDGSHSYIHDGGTGNLKVRSNNFRVSNADESKVSATFQPAGAVELYHNNSKKLETTASSVTLSDNLVMGNHHIELNDNSQIMLGNAPDMRLYHDGSHSYITNTTGDLTIVDESRIKLRTDQFVLNNHANDESIIYAAANGEVSLYHNNVKKFDTTGNGIDVTGTITADNQIILNSGDSTPARIDLYCEVSNAHYTRLQAPAHSTYSGNVTVTIPNASGNLAVLANAANNRIVTATGTHAMTGESTLTYDGSGTLEISDSGSSYTLTGSSAKHEIGASASDNDLVIQNNKNTVNATSNIIFKGSGNGGESVKERLRIDSSGNVLVGTTDSTVFSNGDSADEGIVLRGGDVIDIARKGDLQLTLNRQTNDGPHIAFYRSGGVKSYISTRDSALCFDVNSTTERLRITSTGNLGVAGATGTDFSLLDGMVVNTVNGSAGLMVNSSSSSHNAYISFSYGSGSSTSHNDQFSAYIGRVGDNNLILGTNNSIRVQVTSSGHVVPGTDSQYDLGLTGTRWRAVYADTLYGDGSNLTGISAGTSLSGSTNNTVCTVTGANAIQGEGNLTFDGSTLTLTGNQTASGGGIFGNLSVGETAHSNTIQQRTGGTLHLNYNVTGNVHVNEGGGYMQTRHIRPETDSSHDLGTSGNRYRTVYADGVIGGNLSVGGTYNNTIQNTVSNTVLHIQYNNSGDVRVNEGGGDLQTQDIKPESDSSYNIGTTSARYANIYADRINALHYQSTSTISSNYTVTTTYNEMMIGPITINNGVTLTVNTGARLVIL